MNVWRGVYTTLCVFLLLASQGLCCFNGYTSSNDVGICYKIYTSAVPRSVAAASCVADGARLAVISNAMVNSLIFTQAQQLNTQVWIGLQCDVDNNCGWDDASAYAIGYKNFYPGMPNTALGNCTYLTIKSGGRWLNGDCDQLQIGYACIASNTASASCGDYSHNYNNGQCYKVFRQDSFITDPEAFCVTDGGHLTSIGDAYENQFITWLLPSNSFTARIGLFTTTGSLSYQWTDGTYFGPNSYNNFGSINAALGLCVAIGSGQGNLASGTWGNTRCGKGTTDTLVCKRNLLYASTTQQVPTTAEQLTTSVLNNCGQYYNDNNNYFGTPGFGNGWDLPAGSQCSYYFETNYPYAQVHFVNFFLNEGSSISLYSDWNLDNKFATLTYQDGLSRSFTSPSKRIYLVFNDPRGGTNPSYTTLYWGYFIGSYYSWASITAEPISTLSYYWWPEDLQKDKKTDENKSEVKEKKETIDIPQVKTI